MLAPPPIISSLRIKRIPQGSPNYPARLVKRMGLKAPDAIYVAGLSRRLRSPHIAIIGSRIAQPEFLEAASRLGRAISDAGYVVASGLAAGCDEAAQRGAILGRTGSVGLAPKGLARLTSRELSFVGNRMTFISLAHPDDAFHAGLAIARNDVIAALSEALVLISSGVKGGSMYALRWALRNRLPVWCMTDGSRTPEGNAALIRSKLARPLELSQSPTEWMSQIRNGLAEAAIRKPRHVVESRLSQSDWLSGCL